MKKSPELGKLLKSLREQAHMTQKEAAEGVVTQGYYCEIEAGEKVKQPNAQYLAGIARNLKVDPNILLHAAGYNFAIGPWRKGVENIDSVVIDFFSGLDLPTQRKIVDSIKAFMAVVPKRQ